MKIGIVGVGFVGSAVRAACEPHFELKMHDAKWDCSKLEDVIDTEVCFICVPTPPAPGGTQDLSIVESVCADLQRLGYQGEVVIKSTVLPGTCRALVEKFHLLICHNPEFLTERNAKRDFMQQPRVLVSGLMASKTCKVYEKILPETQVLWFEDTRVTELAKYYHNTFLALKVIYNNEMKAVCDAMGVSFDDVVAGAISQKKILPNHTYVPGPPDAQGRKLPGYGGTCFPKDVHAFIHVAQRAGVPFRLLETAHAINLELRPEEYERHHAPEPV